MIEYKVVESEKRLGLKELNALGADDWDLSHVLFVQSTLSKSFLWVHIFKRRVEPPTSSPSRRAALRSHGD